MNGLRRWSRHWMLFGLVIALPNVASAQGLQLFGIGPVNRSMGSTATAAPIEAIGAINFNPATLTALDNQLSAGAEMVTPLVDIDSSFAGRSGQTYSDSGWSAVPAVALSMKPNPDGPMTIGFGLSGIAGYSVNYPASTTNPILFPQTPNATTPTPGLGNIYGDISILQLAPVIAMQVTPKLSVAAGPTVMAGRLILTPFPFAAPDDANGDGTATYPVGSGTRFAWGVGFQVGAFWKGDNCVNWGVNYRSPQWFQDFESHSHNEIGLPRDLEFKFDYPQIISLGTAYTGFAGWLIAADVRYFDWKNTSDTLGKPASFAPDGSISGLGWNSTWAVSVGAQYQLSDMVALRAGYLFSESPIDDDNAGFNVAAPLILQHSINFGATMRMSKSLSTHIAYYYAPEAEVGGPFQSPAGPVAGSNVSYRVSAHAISLGMTAYF